MLAYHRCCDLPEELEIKYDPRYKESVTDAVMCKMLAPHHLPEKEVDFSSAKTAFDTNKLHVSVNKKKTLKEEKET